MIFFLSLSLYLRTKAYRMKIRMLVVNKTTDVFNKYI